MTNQELLLKADWLCNKAKVPLAKEQCTNFLQYAEFVRDIILHQLSNTQRKNIPWLKDFVEGWARLYGDFEAQVRSDPGMLYVPKSKSTLEYHQSSAFIRYYCSGNGCGKTTSGYIEDYWAVTGTHPHRNLVRPLDVGVICGHSFKDYAPKVFETKLIRGEGNNPLSPLFPEGGKWFNHYDNRKHILTIACPDCAEKGTPQSCSHEKRHIYLFSVETTLKERVMESFQAGVMHFDETTPEPFFKAALQRMRTQPGAFVQITATPLAGMDAWEERLIKAKAEGNPEENRVIKDDPDSQMFASVHYNTQYTAGIMTKEEIERSSVNYDEFEYKVRVMGEVSPLAKNPVFDRKRLEVLNKSSETPRYGSLVCSIPLHDLTTEAHVLDFVETKPQKTQQFTGVRIWEEPKPDVQYIAGCDSAAGLTERDASCCNIYRMELVGLRPTLVQVAQVYGWLHTHDYADEIFKLCTYYNDALAVIELTGGLGRAVLLRLKKDLMYWNIYRDNAGTKSEMAEFHEEARMGVDTNVATKPMMIAITQQMLKDGQLILKDKETISEMVAYEQERSDSGKTTLYRGASGSRDDRVMSTVIACAVALSAPGIWEFALERGKVEAIAHDEEAKEKIWTGLRKEIKERQEESRWQEL